MVDRVAGKTVIVTGAARGIGRAVAVRLALEGARVVIADKDAEGAEVAAAITTSGGLARHLSHDVTQEQSWIALVDSVREHEQAVHGLVNSAGIARRAPLADLALDDWTSVMSVNATGTFLGMKHCAPVIAENGGGSIVNLASIAGALASPSYTAYSASKGAVMSMTRVAAMEYAAHGVRVNAVLPGNTDTDMARYDAAYAGATPEQFAETLTTIYPLGRMADADDDVAPVVLFLISEDARYLTGVHLPVDGGLSAGFART